MITRILPIKNMCGVVVGKAAVTINAIGNVCVNPLGNKSAFKLGGLLWRGEYVHFGLTNMKASQHV